MADDQSDKSIQSPCVRNCCLDDNDVCLGCYRLLEEILQWSASTEEKKREVLMKCNKRRADQLQNFPVER